MNILRKKNFQSYFLNLLPIFLCLIIFSLYLFSTNQPELSLIEYVYIENLINYEGGFVRRGLLGQFIYEINYNLNINPIKIVSILYSFLYTVLIIFFYKICSNLYKINPYLFILILFSPATFLFPLFDFYALFRKEIFFFIIYFYHIYIAQKTILKKQSYRIYQKKYFLIIFPILILSIFIHESQFFFIFFHIMINFIVLKSYKNKFLYLTYVIYFFVFLSFISPASNEAIEQINFSLEKFLPGISDKYTPVTILTGNINLQLGRTLYYIKNSNFNEFIQLFYVFIFSIGLFSFVFLNLLKRNILNIKKYKKSILLINIYSCAFVLFFMILSFDYGRFFNILLMHIIGFYLIFPYKNYKIDELKTTRKIKYLFIILVYIIIFYLPHASILGGQGSIYEKMETGIMLFLKKS